MRPHLQPTGYGEAIVRSRPPASVDVQGLAGDVTGEITAQEQDRLSDLFRGAEPVERNLFEHLFPDFIGDGFPHVGQDDPRCDGIYRDPLAGQLFAEHFCQADHTRFRGRIVRLSEEADDARDRGQVDDPAAFLQPW